MKDRLSYGKNLGVWLVKGITEVTSLEDSPAEAAPVGHHSVKLWAGTVLSSVVARMGKLTNWQLT